MVAVKKEVHAVVVGEGRECDTERECVSGALRYQTDHTIPSSFSFWPPLAARLSPHFPPPSPRPISVLASSLLARSPPSLVPVAGTSPLLDSLSSLVLSRGLSLYLCVCMCVCLSCLSVVLAATSCPALPCLLLLLGDAFKMTPSPQPASLVHSDPSVNYWL